MHNNKFLLILVLSFLSLVLSFSLVQSVVWETVSFENKHVRKNVHASRLNSNGSILNKSTAKKVPFIHISINSRFIIMDKNKRKKVNLASC